MLDAQEYLHLAIKASQEGSHQEALEQLHRCLHAEPDNATAIFLLGAEHAELGMYDRAISEMERALSLDPGLEVAKLQLGMLHASNGDNDKAVPFWDELKDSTGDTSLKLFSEGLIRLCNKETEQAILLLNQGIQANKANAALNQAIANIIGSIQDQANNTESNTAQSDEKDGPYLGAYSSQAMGSER